MPIKIHTLPFGVFVNSYLIQSEGYCILIDAGVPDSIGSFLKNLKNISVKPDQINLLIITHTHWDHIGSAQAIKERCGAQIAVHYQEKVALETGKTSNPPPLTSFGKILGAAMRMMPERAVPGVEADIVLTDDGLDLRAYGIPGRVVYTPGHTAGSVSLVLETGEAFVGDLAMSSKFMRLRPGLPIVGDDAELVHKSWQVLLDFGAQIIYPAHGRPFSARVFEKALGL